jgi:hypothetical protein
VALDKEGRALQIKVQKYEVDMIKLRASLAEALEKAEGDESNSDVAALKARIQGRSFNLDCLGFVLWMFSPSAAKGVIADTS